MIPIRERARIPTRKIWQSFSRESHDCERIASMVQMEIDLL